MKGSKKYSFLILCTLYLVLPFSSCKKENMLDMFKSTGPIVTEERTVDPFTDIEVGSNKINVIITQDVNFSVEVEAGSHLIKLITTEVRDGKLYIENDNKCNFVRSYKKAINVYIHMPLLHHIVHGGSGTISSTNQMTGDTLDILTKSAGDVDLSVNYFTVRTHMHSCGDITLTGSCNEDDCYATGNGFFHGENLSTNYTWIYAKTTGDIHINATSLLIVDIESIGDVYYSGDPPSLQEKLDSSGKLIAL